MLSSAPFVFGVRSVPPTSVPAVLVSAPAASTVSACGGERAAGVVQAAGRGGECQGIVGDDLPAGAVLDVAGGKREHGGAG